MGQDHGGSSLHANSVVNVHTSCLKEIEELNFSSTEGGHKKAIATEANKSKEEAMEIPLTGQKRTYVDAAAMEESSKINTMGNDTKEKDAIQLRGLQDIIRGLESQKRRKLI